MMEAAEKWFGLAFPGHRLAFPYPVQLHKGTTYILAPLSELASVRDAVMAEMPPLPLVPVFIKDCEPEHWPQAENWILITDSEIQTWHKDQRDSSAPMIEFSHDIFRATLKMYGRIEALKF